jgi:hypothetical protein
MYEGDEDIYRALKAGASTYLLKNTLDDLVPSPEVHGGKHPSRPRSRTACGPKTKPPHAAK